jgi:hypothetical protein
MHGAMHPKKVTAAEQFNTWDLDWETRLASYVRSAGYSGMWDYVHRFPGEPYDVLSERLCETGGFGVAPVQVQRLQVRDTPDAEQPRSIRDSLARHLRQTLKDQTWGQGPYWESRAIAALAPWTAMWSSRVDLSPHRRQLFALGAPVGWSPADEGDPYLLALVPDATPA